MPRWRNGTASTWTAEGRVEYLDLSDNGLTGSIPPEVGRLSELRTLYAGNNLLTGPLSSSSGSLS